jgi:hypothetical protein
MPRRFAYSEPPESTPSYRPAPLARVGVIVVQARRPGGVVVAITLDPARYATPMLARQLAQAWAERFATEAQPSFHTVGEHRRAVVDLLNYLGRVGAPANLSCRALTAELLDHWQDDAAARFSPGHGVRAAGQNAGVVFALLRRIAENDPAAVAPAALARARKPAAHAYNNDSTPLCEFTTADLRRLIPTAMRGVWDTERRILAGRALRTEGEDPRGSGRWSFANLVWLAAGGELTMALLKQHLPQYWRDWDQTLRQRAGTRAGDYRGRVGQLLRLAYQHVFPHPLDLVGHFVLIVLDTAAWPEGVKDLTVASTRAMTDGIGVDLVKNRLPGSIEKLAAGGGGAGPANQFRDAGSVLRSLIDVTEQARSHCGSEMAFVAGILRPRGDGVKVGPVRISYFHPWVVANGLDRPLERTVTKGSGQVAVTLPALTTPWDSRRLRKATLVHYAQHHPTEMAAWRDNTLAVFQQRYVAGSVVLRTAIGRLARQGATDLAQMVTDRTGFTVVSPGAAEELRAQTAGAARVLRLDRAKLALLATGQLDVDGGIAACTDANASPFANPGELCRAARLGLCLMCPNAVLTPDHVPGLRRFDAEVIEAHRRALDPAAFAQRWVPIRLAVRWALGQLGDGVDEAPHR